MQNQASLQETKQHGAVRFPFNLYPCTIPGDFPQVALHWQESMELVFVKRGTGLVQVGAESCPARMGDIFIFTPGTLHALRQAEGQCMEYENIIFELELLGGAEDLCAEKYLLPLQSGRLSLPARLTPNDLCYLQAAACLREVEDANRAKLPGYELQVKGALLRFLALLLAQGSRLGGSGLAVAVVDHHIAALLCQREADGPADAPASASDDGGTGQLFFTHACASFQPVRKASSSSAVSTAVQRTSVPSVFFTKPLRALPGPTSRMSVTPSSPRRRRVSSM